MNTHDHVINQIVEELESGGITGWCPVQKALELASWIIAMRPKLVLETGVWGGRSLIPMALACEAVGHGTVIGIDPWMPSASTEGYTGENARWWAQQDHELVYHAFIRNIRRLGLQDRVAVHRAKSEDVAEPQALDLVHLDSQHTEMAVREVRKFAPQVRMGGIVCLDDLEWVNDGVQHVGMAVKELLGLGFVELHRTKQSDGCWGFFQRVEIPVKHAKKKGRK